MRHKADEVVQTSHWPKASENGGLPYVLYTQYFSTALRHYVGIAEWEEKMTIHRICDRFPATRCGSSKHKSEESSSPNAE